MNIGVKISLFSVALIMTQQLAADHVITFFLRPYPYFSLKKPTWTPQKAQRKSKKLQRPEKLAKYHLRPLLENKIESGIFCTYMGQLVVSNPDGQVTFARRQEKASLKLLITPKIDPKLVVGQTIHHWELETGVPAALYSAKQQEDPKTEIEFWQVKRIPIPTNNRISLSTITIFAKPNHIFVPEGISIIEQNSQLVLPDLYVKKHIDKLSSSLYILNLKRFFSPPKKIHQPKEKQYSVQTH